MTALRKGRVAAQLMAFCLRSSLPFLSSTKGDVVLSLAFLAAGADGDDEEGADFLGVSSALAACTGFFELWSVADGVMGRFSASLEGALDRIDCDFVVEAFRLRVLVAMVRSMLMSESESMASKHDEGEGEGGGARTLIARPWGNVEACEKSKDAVKLNDEGALAFRSGADAQHSAVRSSKLCRILWYLLRWSFEGESAWKEKEGEADV